MDEMFGIKYPNSYETFHKEEDGKKYAFVAQNSSGLPILITDDVTNHYH